MQSKFKRNMIGSFKLFVEEKRIFSFLQSI